MVRQTKRTRNMRGGACEIVSDFTVCSTKPAYNGKKFSNLSPEEKKYAIQVTDYTNQTYCLDIRQIVKEVKEGKTHYELGKYSLVTSFYYFGTLRKRFVEKENECLGTNEIETKFQQIKETLFPSGDRTYTNYLRDFLVAIAYYIRLALVIHPAEELIAARLHNQWAEIYRHTHDYKTLSKLRNLQIVNLAGTEAYNQGLKYLQYNPLDKTERSSILTPEQITEDDEAINRIISMRLANNGVAVEDRIMSTKNLLGLARSEEIRRILDSDINSIKATTFLCILQKFVSHLEKEGFDKQLDEAHRILVSLKGEEQPFHNETILTLYSGSIFGGKCLRVETSNLIKYLDFLHSMLPEIQELDPSKTLDFASIPSLYKSCFEEKNRDYTEDEFNTAEQLLERHQTQFGSIFNVNACALENENQRALQNAQAAQQALLSASAANLTRQIEEKEIEKTAAIALYKKALNNIRLSQEKSKNEWNNDKVEAILGADEYMNQDNYVIQETIPRGLLNAALEAQTASLFLQSKLQQLRLLRNRASQGGNRRTRRGRKMKSIRKGKKTQKH